MQSRKKWNIIITLCFSIFFREKNYIVLFSFSKQTICVCSLCLHFIDKNQVRGIITIAFVLKPVRKTLIFINLLHVLIKSTESSSTCLDRSISKIRSVPLHVWDKTSNILFVQSYRNEKCTNCFKFGRAVANFSAKRSCHPPLPQPRIFSKTVMQVKFV